MANQDLVAIFKSYVKLQGELLFLPKDTSQVLRKSAQALYQLFYEHGFRISTKLTLSRTTGHTITFMLKFWQEEIWREHLHFSDQETREFNLACAISFFDKFIALANQDYRSKAIDQALKETETEINRLGFQILVVEPETEDLYDSPGETKDNEDTKLVRLALVKSGDEHKEAIRTGVFRSRVPAHVDTKAQAITLFRAYCQHLRAGFRDGRIRSNVSDPDFDRAQDNMLSELRALGWIVKVIGSRAAKERTDKTVEVTILLMLMPSQRKNDAPIEVEKVVISLQRDESDYLFRSEPLVSLGEPFTPYDTSFLRNCDMRPD